MNALMCPTEPRTTMSAPLSEIPQRAEASPPITSNPPRAVAPADWLAEPSTTTVPDIMFSATPPAVAMHANGRSLVHPGAVVAGMTLDLDLVVGVEPDRQRVPAAGVEDQQARGRARVAARRAADRSAPGRCRGQIDDVTASRTASPALITPPAPCPSCRRARVGLPGDGMLGAGEHRDRPVLGGHRHPIVGLGQDRRFAGDRITQHREPVRRADGERVKAVEIVEAALERLLKRCAFAHPPGQVAGGDLGVVLGLKADALPGSVRRSRLWFESEPLWTRHRSRPVENGCEPCVVTRLSVAIRVWPSACVPSIRSN